MDNYGVGDNVSVVQDSIELKQVCVEVVILMVIMMAKIVYVTGGSIQGLTSVKNVIIRVASVLGLVPIIVYSVHKLVSILKMDTALNLHHAYLINT